MQARLLGLTEEGGRTSGSTALWMAPVRPDKGRLLHSLMDGAGMLWSRRTTPAHGNERAQVIPLSDTIHMRAGKRGVGRANG